MGWVESAERSRMSARGVAVLGDLLDGEREGEEAGAGAAVLLGDRKAEEAGVSEDLEDVVRVLAGLVEFGGARARPSRGRCGGRCRG